MPASGTVVAINDTAPTADRYNLSFCEILPVPLDINAGLETRPQLQRALVLF